MHNAMNRRRFIASVAALSGMAAVPWLSACSPQRPLVVGIHTWVGYETLYLARDFNWLPASVQLLATREISGSALAMQSGQADAACMTLDEVLRLRAEGLPLSVIMVFDISAGADVVLARKGINKLADLAGKRIGLEQNALGTLVLEKLLEAAKLPASSVTLVECPPDRQLKAWRANEVDVIVTYEPTATLVLREGAQRLFDSRQMPDLIYDVLAVNVNRLQGRGNALRSLVAGHFRGLEHLRASRQDSIYRIATRENISPDEVQLVLGGVVFPSLNANREYLADNDNRLMRAAKTLSSLMARRGMIKHEDKLENLITRAWLPREER
jgi:NitT/TauT family transport system substrate-binding protein